MWYLIVSIPDLCTITYFCLKKDVENWMLETTLPKHEDYEKDSNSFCTVDFFLFVFLWALRKILYLNICLLGFRFCKNKLIYISSDNYKGTLSCLLNGP